MKVLIILVIHLIHSWNFVHGSNDLLCKASPDSTLFTVLGDEENQIACTTNPNSAEVGDLRKELDITKTRLNSVRFELNELMTIIKELNRTRNTENVIKEILGRVSAELFPSFLRRVAGNQLKMDGWMLSQTFAFKAFKHAVSRDVAAGECMKEKGGRLATEVLRYPDAAKYILDKYSGLNMWVGFDDIQSEGTWVWSDGGDMNPETTSWHPNEPNSYKGRNEDCGHIVSSSKEKLLLNDEPCGNNHNYICEIDLNQYY